MHLSKTKRNYNFINHLNVIKNRSNLRRKQLYRFNIINVFCHIHWSLIFFTVMSYYCKLYHYSISNTRQCILIVSVSSSSKITMLKFSFYCLGKFTTLFNQNFWKMELQPHALNSEICFHPVKN